MGEGEQGKLFKNFISVGIGMTKKSIFYFPRGELLLFLFEEYPAANYH
jgi:hypothetical protein